MCSLFCSPPYLEESFFTCQSGTLRRIPRSTMSVTNLVPLWGSGKMQVRVQKSPLEGCQEMSCPIGETAQTLHQPPARAPGIPVPHHTLALPLKPQALTKGYLSPVVERFWGQIPTCWAPLLGCPLKGGPAQRPGGVAWPPSLTASGLWGQAWSPVPVFSAYLLVSLF